MALLVTDQKSITGKPKVNSSTSVFDKGSYSLKTVTVATSSPSSPPTPLLVVTSATKGTFPVILFFHGFCLSNTFYLDLLQHISSHGYILVAPQTYEFPNMISGPKEIESGAQVIEWLNQGLQSSLPDSVEPDFSKFVLAGHSRGGKAAFALALGHGNPTLKPSALIGIDPVAGTKCTRTKPYILTYEPRSLKISIPVAVIGSGLGPDQRNCMTPPCAPEGLNHEEFFRECQPPCAHFVAKDYGHMGVLDDHPRGVIGALSGCMCKNGTGPRDYMRRSAGGIVVAFLRAYLDGCFDDLEAIVGDPGLSPAKLDPVEFIPQ